MRLFHSSMDNYLTIDRLNAVSSTPSSIQPVNGWETKSSANACGVQVWLRTILEEWVRSRSCRRRIRTMRSLTRRRRIDRRKSVSQKREGKARQRRSGQLRVCRNTREYYGEFETNYAYRIQEVWQEEIMSGLGTGVCANLRRVLHRWSWELYASLYESSLRRYFERSRHGWDSPSLICEYFSIALVARRHNRFFECCESYSAQTNLKTILRSQCHQLAQLKGRQSFSLKRA